MSTSRYSAKAHQRDRQALFSTEDLSKSPSPQPQYNTNNSINNVFGINGYDTHAEERQKKDDDYIPTSISVSSPYDNIDKHSKPSYSTTAQGMAQLESQAEETVSIMKNKIGALKDLSLAMGTEINKSKKNLVELGEDMGMSSEKIKYNMNRMRRFVEKSGVGWKVWLGFTIIILWWFVWVWLF